MTRDYLKKAIKKNFFELLDRDEITDCVEKNEIFKEYGSFLPALLRQQNPKLDEEEYLGTVHQLFYEIIQRTAIRIIHPSPDPLSMEQTADTTLLIISVYNEYDAICYPSLMYKFLQLVLKEKTLLV